jgi:hypothetical protein
MFALSHTILESPPIQFLRDLKRYRGSAIFHFIHFRLQLLKAKARPPLLCRFFAVQFEYLGTLLPTKIAWKIGKFKCITKKLDYPATATTTTTAAATAATAALALLLLL